MPLYLPPIFVPERTMPPGNGMIASGTVRMASIAASAARNVVWYERPMRRRLPPPTASLVRPVVASHRNSPSMTGIAPEMPAVADTL